MSLIESSNLPTLFFNNTITDNFFLSKEISENLNDSLYEAKSDIPPKQIKFILTKEAPSIHLLQKKTTLDKINDSNILSANSNSGRWNKEEQKSFADAVLKFGNDWKKIQNHVFSRNITQVRSHAQKFLMKLKENKFIKNKGVIQSMSWTKTMNLLRNILSYDELKEILFSVEQNEEKPLKKKKKKKKISKISNNFDTNSEINFKNSHFFFEDEENIKRNKKNEEEEEQMLKKFIECFNSPSGEITLNTSFEESSNNEDDNNQYKFLEGASINYSISLNNI